MLKEDDEKLLEEWEGAGFLLFAIEGNGFAGCEHEDVKRRQVGTRVAVGIRSRLAQNSNTIQIEYLRRNCQNGHSS